jgi:hypothetical protein
LKISWIVIYNLFNKILFKLKKNML